MIRFPRKAFLLLALGALSSAAHGHGRQLPVTAPPPPPTNWQVCPDAPTRQCATLTVPLDYADLGKGFIDLAVVRAPATGEPIGTLIFNPGGPAQPVTGSLKFNDLALMFSAEVLSRFDVVGFDPRGTNAPFPCMDVALQELYYETNHLPRTDGEIGNLMNLERQINQGCVANNQPLVNHIDTASGVRDLEQLRRALGLASFSYWGNSYGTFLGYRYAHLYPGKLRAMMLDGVSDRIVSDQQNVEENSHAFEQVWSDFKAWCHATESCQLRGRNIDGVLDLLLSQARANPIPAPFAPDTQRPVNDWQILLTLQIIEGFGDITFGWMDQTISEALDGNASIARFFYDLATGILPGGSYGAESSERRAVTCIDTYWSRTLKTVPDVRAFANRLQQVSPRFGETSAYQATNCFGYPVMPVETPPMALDLVDAPPILIVGGSRDVATPLKWSARLAAQLPTSSLLVRNGYGHLSFQKSRCVQQHVIDFLVDLTLPASGTTCQTDPDLYPPQDPLPF